MKSNLRKCAVIAAIAVSAIVFLPVAAFAKGAVVGYASGDCGDVSIEQLKRLTHVMAVERFHQRKNIFEKLIQNQILFCNFAA